MVAKIATGEIEESAEHRSGRSRGGAAGAKARAAKLTPEKRSEIARRAASGSWK
jgi:hypothetical protein